MKEDPQASEEHGFLPVCVHLWMNKFDFFVNEYKLSSKENGFSPVCDHLQKKDLDFHEK